MSQRPASARDLPSPENCSVLRVYDYKQDVRPITASMVPETPSRHSPRSNHQSSLVEILNLETKALVYSNNSSSRSNTASPIQADPRSPPSSKTQKPKKPAELAEIHYLITAGIMDNFYVNIISWCPLSQKLAIGINEVAYWWNGQLEVQGFWTSPDESSISCLKCGGGYVLVATDDGTVTIMDSLGCLKGSLSFPSSVLCASWTSGQFFVGDRTGAIHSISVKGRVAIKPIVHEFYQQVTGKFFNFQN
ncbi:hypothetical protein CXQ85_000362 [Candidozyma haemuli]|uniref:Anaphase-promoting complex subunit 4 WD40 domain-containing protein n=1 Tax=Candidozyma haemuli TaxID=45357 RepID=A0A2V1AU83_9ASCO|nr:hypothetical protein CXQ85_000362 [[Candida] haemuloni]PVH21385.1 hypothetical protein CXQ85_000362 [[Candida] haemuloni]